MKAMETIEDLIEEAKVRFVWWALFIFSIAYFLSHTSSSMWMNFPIAIILAFALRILFNEVEIHWKTHQTICPQSYLSHLEKKQLSVNDTRLSSMPPPPRWKRKIDSPVVESAINNFIDLILKDFVVDLWYSEITPDKEAPELMHAVIVDAIGEISTRIKQINLVDLLTRDIVDLVGDHLDLFRRNQATIGVDVMRTLSTEERDERLKHHLMTSKELHPALVSVESEYKVLQRLIGAVLAIVLRSREVQSPLVRTIAREIVTCLVLQPVMNLASPAYINEVIEDFLLAINDTSMADSGGDRFAEGVHYGDSTSSKYSSLNSQGAEVFDNRNDNQAADIGLTKTDNDPEGSCDYDANKQETLQSRNADWVRMLEAATQRRTEVLAPENLENLWTKGRNYKRKDDKNFKSAVVKGSSVKSLPPTRNSRSLGREAKATVKLSPRLDDDNLVTRQGNEELYFKGAEFDGMCISSVNERKSRLKRSSSTSALKMELGEDGGGPVISEFYSLDFSRYSVDNATKVQDTVIRSEGPHVPKLRCRVMGAYFEKLGSKSFAVYSIAVTDSENRTWFVKRRYRNFERLHRYLKEIPNYTLHLPPKRIFSSSTEDAFVHQRCIQLDKYLQDLLSIANVAEQHEVWDFLSVSSKNYSFGKSSSVMRTLAVNVDDAVDDIVRQFKGGFKRKPVGASAPLDESSSILSGNSSWHAEEMSKDISRQDTLEVLNSSSDNEERHKQECLAQEEVVSGLQAKGWHSDNELNLKCFPHHVIKHAEEPKSLDFEKRHGLVAKARGFNQVGFSSANYAATSSCVEDPIGMPAEWTPPNVSVPLLNLVDKVFQLKRRGWLRRQVFWISKQILQLVMEDAIDDWLLRQIYWLRREETVAQGIRWLQDVLWPNSTFFTRVGVAQNNVQDGQFIPFQVSQFRGSKASKADSFEEQLEAARRVSNIKKLLFDGAPTTLVSLIGNKQYKRCARDIFYFTQSTICVKQLAYGILEVLLLSVFPELRDVLLELHGKLPAPPA